MNVVGLQGFNTYVEAEDADILILTETKVRRYAQSELVT